MTMKQKQPDRDLKNDAACEQEKKGRKKGRFKRFLERLAEENQKSGGQICLS